MSVAADLPAVKRAPSRGASISRGLWAVAIAGLLVVAVLLRFWQLANIPGVNGDEAWSGVQAVRLARGLPVTWHTPSGNPVNVFFLLPLAALHWVFEPSFALLRSVSVASGLAAIVVNWWRCRRTYDRTTAVVSTVLVAILPINIAYSRFAWDASQTLLATLLVMYLPLIWIRRWPAPRAWLVAAAVAFAAAAVVHPTNIFTAPLVAVPILYARRRWIGNRLRAAVASDRPAVLVGMVVVSALLTYVGWTAVTHLSARFSHPGEVFEFLGLYVRLLSGATTYEYITGAAEAGGFLGRIPVICNLLVLLVILLATGGWLQRLTREEDDVDVCLLSGAGLVVLGFALVAGPQSLVPHLERYGICLVAPAVLVVARGIAWWLRPQYAYHRLVQATLVIAAGCFVASFCLAYFHALHRTGGLSHRAFSTAAVEPKQQAFERIVADRAKGERSVIVASSWWLYWPLAYLAGNDPGLHVTGLDGPWDERAAAQPAGSESVQTWYVEFADTSAEAALARRLQRRGEFGGRETIVDYSGKPLISLIRAVHSPPTKKLP